LNSDQIANAMGIAGSQAAGLQEFMQVGSWIKRFHPGWASHAGIIAAQMASRGFTGPKTVFEGKFGLYRSHLGNARYNLTKLNGQLGKRWELLNISFKPYPCCNFSHAFMDCAFDTIRKSRLKLEDVKEITCKIHPTEAQLVMEPRKLKQAPKTEYDAKFSLPYSIGLLLVEGEAGTQQFTPEKLKDPKVLEVARKVKYTRYNDPFFPRYFPGWVVITTKNGKKYQNRITKNHGTKENPMSRSEIVAKFKANASRAISHEKVNKIIAAIDKLEQLPSASELTDLLS
jgi:2-methylcitrate dehydratase PrpD